MQQSQACGRIGLTPHATMVWGSIAPTTTEVRTTGRWPFRETVRTSTQTWQGREPDEGNLAPTTLAALLHVLSRFTATGMDCYHAVWEGWSWLNAGQVRLYRTGFRWGAAPAVTPPSPLLAVLTGQVGQAADGWVTADPGVGPMVVVGV